MHVPTQGALPSGAFPVCTYNFILGGCGHAQSCHLQIDAHSKGLMQPRMRVLQEHNLTAHEQLYQDSLRRQARDAEYRAWYPDDATFRPTLVARPSTAGSLRVPQPGSSTSPVTSQFRVISGNNQAHQRLYAHHQRKEVCFPSRGDWQPCAGNLHWQPCAGKLSSKWAL